MSDVNKEVKQEETNSLAPIPEKDRIMGWGSNTMLWLGGCISIGTLAMGSAQMAPVPSPKRRPKFKSGLAFM